MAQFLSPRGGVRKRAKGGLEVLQRANAHGIFAGLAIVEKIRGWEKARHALDRTAHAVNRVFGVGFARATRHGQHQRQMPTRTGPGDAQTIWVHTVIAGMVTDEADRAMNVPQDFSDNEFGLRTMHDGEDSVAAVQEWLIFCHTDVFVRGEPTTTDHENDPNVVGFPGSEHVERECRAELAAVNHILGAFVRGGKRRLQVRQDRYRQKYEAEKLFHIGFTLALCRGIVFNCKSLDCPSVDMVLVKMCKLK